MTSDDELREMLRAKWRANQRPPSPPKPITPSSRPKAKTVAAWGDVVQLNVRIPASAKGTIEAAARSRGWTLAQFIVAAAERFQDDNGTERS